MKPWLLPLLLTSLALSSCSPSNLRTEQPNTNPANTNSLVGEPAAIAAVPPTPIALPAQQTYSNGQWTITLSHQTSQRHQTSQKNHPASITYKGCAPFGGCTELKTTNLGCQDGLCMASWQDGDYRYAMQWMTPQADRTQVATLTIWKGSDRVIEIKDLLATRS